MDPVKEGQEEGRHYFDFREAPYPGVKTIYASIYKVVKKANGRGLKRKPVGINVKGPIKLYPVIERYAWWLCSFLDAGCVVRRGQHEVGNETPENLGKTPENLGKTQIIPPAVGSSDCLSCLMDTVFRRGYNCEACHDIFPEGCNGHHDTLNAWCTECAEAKRVCPWR